MLECNGVSKSFGGIVALDALDVSVGGDRITGLVGPNGAGKTTLFDVVSGVRVPDGGTVRFGGTDVTGWLPHRTCRAGLARTFQTPRPVGSLTVEENLLVGRAYGRTGADGPDVEAVLSALSLSDRRTATPGGLKLTERKRVDLARALMTAPDLVLVDEPLAGLPPGETDAVVETLRTLHAEFGVGFLVVEHDLRAVRSLADRVVVVDDGRVLATGSPDEVLADDAVREAYVGA